MSKVLFIHVALVFSCLCVRHSDCMSSMAVDLGSESMKVAVIRHKIPMEVVLDGHAKRKTPTAIGFRNGDRVFGADAIYMASLHPSFVYQNFPSIIGKHINHPAVKLFRQRYPYHNMTYEEKSGQLLFHHPDGMSYTVEELVAMLLEYARDITEQHAEAVIKTCVLTVPSFYGQAEKASLVRAVQLAGLELQQLIDVNTAVALNFGIFRRNLFTESAQYFMFYDVGYLSTTATVVSFQMGKQQSGGSSQDPFLTIIGIGAVPDLGTSSLIYRIRDHFAQVFSDSTGIPLATLQQNARAMSRLLREATRVFLILSANTEAHSNLEQLLDNADFRTQITREKMEMLCQEEFKKFHKPFTDALIRSGVNVAVIQDIVLMGGGTRIPKVQEILMGLGQRSALNKGLNNDEAAVMGAIYQAAFHTPGFRVLPFGVKDYNPYTIGVDFKRAPQSNSGDDSNETNSDIRRVLFPRGNPFPQKRAITFNRHTTDLTFYVNYVDLNDEEATYLRVTNLTRVTTEGVAKVLKKHPGSKLRGVQAHFTLNYSGLLTLTGVDCLMQPIATPDAEKPSKDESAFRTFEELGNTISGFFGVGGQKKVKESVPPDGTENATNATQSLNETDVNGNVTSNSTIDDVNQTEKTKIVDENVFQASVNKTKPLKPFTERIAFNLEVLYAPVPSVEEVKKSIEKLRSLREVQRIKREREQMANELESSIFSIREHMNMPIYITHSTEDERHKLSGMLTIALEWFEEQDTQTPKEVYEEKLLELRRLYIPIHSRVREAEKRPVAFEELNKTITTARSTIVKLREINEFMYKLHQSLNEKQKLLKQKEHEQFPEQDPVLEKNTSVHPPSTSSEDNDTTPDGEKPVSTIGSNITEEENPDPPFTPIFDETDMESLKKSVEDVLDWMDRSVKSLSDSVPYQMPPVLVEDIQMKHEQIKSKLIPLQSKFALFQAEMERAQQHQETTSKPDRKQKSRVKVTSDEDASMNATLPEAVVDSEPASAEVPKRPPHSEL